MKNKDVKKNHKMIKRMFDEYYNEMIEINDEDNNCNKELRVIFDERNDKMIKKYKN